ncbi:MAG TPA: SLC13 family permease [Dehalococcoidia bacterium]|nr:SLC13 family permease [Dehalococcoidia bacterium]
MTLAVLAIAMGLFISGKFRADLVAICVLAALLVTGLIRPDQALYGFANPAVATIAAMFVVSAGLLRTGLLQWVSRRIDVLAGKGEWRLVLVLCIVAAVLSAFLVNTAIVAIFIPVAIVLAKSRKIAPSRVLIPLSFASQFGGVCTIIGTSTNLLVNGIGISKGLQPFAFFEFAPLGLVMILVGTAYLLIAGRWLLPKRKGEAEQVDKYQLADYMAELQVQGNSVLVGQTWSQSKASRESMIELTNLVREDKAVARPQQTVIRPGDLLLLHGHIKQIMEMQQKYGLELLKNAKVLDKQLSAHETQLVEVLLPPGSSLVGKTLSKSDYFRRYKAIILAIQRRGRTIKERLADTILESGDTLLLQAHNDDITRLMNTNNAIVTSKLNELHFNRDKAVTAILIMLGMILLIVFNILPILTAAIIAAIAMVLTRCLKLEDAYNAIDWKIILLLGGIIPLGLALEQNGVATWLADSLLQPLLVYGPVALLAALYIVTALLTETMSNNAAAAILAPIAIFLAQSLNVDPRPFLVAIAFAASTSFATPIGYQTNTMIYAPGGYRFTDFTLIGLPLNLIFWALATLLIPLIWPF